MGILIVLYLIANFNFIKLTLAINLSSVLTNHNPCRNHLVFNNISTSELSTTRNVPVTLTKRNFPADFVRWVTPTDIISQVDILQNKGWLCEIVIFFVTIDSPSYTKSHEKSLGYWIAIQSSYYFTLNRNNNLEIYPDNLYFPLISSSSKILLATNSPLYSQSLNFKKQLPVHFAVLLFLTENRVQLCHKKSLESFPILQNCVCTTTNSVKSAALINPLNYPPISESNWIYHPYFKSTRV